MSVVITSSTTLECMCACVYMHVCVCVIGVHTFVLCFYRFGPLRHQWCMRFEGKNAHIKQLVGKNFKNLPKSLSQRHQRYMCLQLLSPPGVKCDNFLYSGDEIKLGESVIS